MPDLLTTSLGGMLAFQRALDMTGHNIANANTPGYNRQIAQFGTRAGGIGTQITTIKRIYDEMLGEQLQSATSSHARFATLSDLSSRIDSLLADPQTGLSSSMQSFFSALQDVANDPSSIPARQAMLGEAEGVVQRLQALDNRLSELNREANQRVATSVADINQLAASIAEVNDQVILANGISGQPPNDLLDRRDYLIRQLGEQVSVTTVAQDDGALNVFMASGQALVTGNRVNNLTVQSSEFDPTSFEVAISSSSGTTPLDNRIPGGILGGLLEYRSQILEPVRRSLGETAAALVTQFNQQHESGMDLRGALGGEFFTMGDATVLTSSRNAGNGSAMVRLTDVSALVGSDYLLEFDGSTFEMRRSSDGQLVPLSGSGTVADPFIGDGLSITTAGTPVAGDRFLIKPTSDISSTVALAINDPLAIAMASPIRATTIDSNLGDGRIRATGIVDTTDPNLLSPSTIQFTSATTYSINGAGSFAYVSGDPITVNGAGLIIEGAPAAGDQFVVSVNSGGTGDNSNGLLLANVQSQGILSNGSVSINESYGQLVASVGGTTRQVQANFDAQSVLLANTEDSYLSKSGVNLDEEAANLLRYQQAYQAAAQVVAVANTLFDSLLNATRR